MNKMFQSKQLRDFIDELCDVPFESDVTEAGADDTIDFLINPAEAANMRAKLEQFARSYAHLDQPTAKPSPKSSRPDKRSQPPPPRKM